MATPYAQNLTRTWWADTDADRDIHIEAYEGQIDGSFHTDSMFRSGGLTDFRSVQNQTNSYRFDRIGGVKVQGRRSGQELVPSRIINDKAVITVDAVSYIRTNYDFQDNWTSPDFQNEYVREHGITHAKEFDKAHVIQLLKAGQWVAPSDLKASGSFNDGITSTLTGFAAATTAEAKANLIVQYHQQVIEEFIRRDLGDSLGEFACLIRPEWFTILLNHSKLMNVEFQGGQGDNSFSQRRIGWLNGQRITETPRFPTAAITDHYLGPQFNINATEAKSGLIMFHPRKTLITVEAMGMTVKQWDSQEHFQSYLDSYCMYNIGVRRGDATAVLRAD